MVRLLLLLILFANWNYSMVLRLIEQCLFCLVVPPLESLQKRTKTSDKDLGGREGGESDIPVEFLLSGICPSYQTAISPLAPDLPAECIWQCLHHPISSGFRASRCE